MRILLGIPLLWLSLQSTGYAASNVVRELAEVVGPTIRRVMQVVRPSLPLAFGESAASASVASVRHFSAAPRRPSAIASLLRDNSLVVHRAARPFASASVHRRDFSTLPSSGDARPRRFYSEKIDINDSWERIQEVAGSLPGEIPPKLNIDDSWDKIDEVTRRYCVTTTGTIDDIFKGPARWMQSLVSLFKNMESSMDIYERTIREKVIDTVYTWDSVLEKLHKYSLSDAQRVAVDNINIIRDKAVREINK